MAHYRLSGLDLSTRMMLAFEMLQPIPDRKWGRATELARTYAVRCSTFCSRNSLILTS